MNAARIRRATVVDAGSLGRLGALLVQEHHDFDRRRFLPAATNTAQLYASFLTRQLDEPDVVVLVAEHETRVIGYAYGAVEGYNYMALRGPAAVLHDLVVDPDYRGRGVGGALLDAIVTALSAHGAPRVVLSTADRNKSGATPLRANGFSANDDRDDQGHTAVKLTLVIMGAT